MNRYDRKLIPGTRQYNTDWDVISSNELTELFDVTYTHMSPDCKTFSGLALSFHKRFFINDFLGQSDEAYAANGHAVKLFNACVVCACVLCGYRRMFARALMSCSLVTTRTVGAQSYVYRVPLCVST